MKFEINHEGNYCIFYLFGDHSIEEMLAEHAEASKQFPDDPNFAILIEMTHANVEFHLDDLRSVLNMNRVEMKNSGFLLRTAVVGRMMGLNLIGETFALLGFDLPLKLGTFNNLDAAVRWLGLESEQPEIEAAIARMAQQTQ